MAKYEVVHRCNHPEVVTLFGPAKDRERRLEWLRSLPCPECVSIDRLTSAAALHELQEAAGLPCIVGSEKQIAWAVQIRQDFLTGWKKIERRLTEAAVTEEPVAALAEQLLFEGDAYVSDPLMHAEAVYWIDHRTNLTASAIELHLYTIRHEIAEQFKTVVGDNLPITDSDKIESIRLAIEQRKVALDERRQKAAEERIQKAAQKQQTVQQAVNTKANEEKRLWNKKDANAALIRSALGNAGNVSVRIWMRDNEKRVYCNWGRNNSACLYITGNQRHRPGTFEAGTGVNINGDALKVALEKVSKDWNMVSFSVDLDGKAT